MKRLLPATSTLATLAAEINNAENFARDVLGNMTGHKRDCQVRLALDTTVKWPDYRIEFFIYDDIDGEEVAFPQTAGIYRGRGHRAVPYDGKEHDRPWSHAAMRFAEVQQLIGKLMGDGKTRWKSA
ncbi:hypothetical protein ACCS56_17585 [Rhizobium ruizarguesonis]